MSEGGPLPPAEIVSVGLVTPVGLYAAAASAAIAAGRSRARRSEVVGQTGERQAMHLVEEGYLEPLNPGIVSIGCTVPHRRMLQLGGAALAEAAAGCPAPALPPLLLALPEVLPGSADLVGESFVSHLATQAGIQIDEARSATYRQGGAGVLFALRDALEMLAAKKVSHIIIGGVDTFLDVMRLATLDSEGRLCGPHSRLGFMPGEGAGFLLLRAPQERQRGKPLLPPGPHALARVLAVGTGAEKGHRYSKEPYRGDGLAEAFEALFQGLPPSHPKVRCVYAGFNGEEMPAKEWGVARLRNPERFADELRVEHPADCIGDSGAALGAIMLGLAALAIDQGYWPEPRPIWANEDPGPCLVWSTSDRETRAVALLQR